ncbi:MAG: hypothetical protein ACE5O2_01190 [Armatimonadota bacterium]
MDKIAYGGWPNCYKISNGIMDLVVTTDVGPRIIRVGFEGERNLFKEYPDMLGKTGGDEWRIYGGHRLWHSPEAKPRTYSPDNAPVKATPDGDTLRVVQPPEPDTGVQKEMDIRLSTDNARVRVTHRLRNTGLWPVRLSVWCLSVMAPGGRAIVPQPTKADPDRLLPNRVLVLWPYTDTTDPRLHLGKKYVILRQDPNAQEPIKIGINDNEGWGAYVNDGYMFLKKFRYVEGATYPDFGASLEVYTNDEMLELETLSPLVTLQPSEQVEHVEHWFLFKDVEATDEASVDANVLPIVRSAP